MIKMKIPSNKKLLLEPQPEQTSTQKTPNLDRRKIKLDLQHEQHRDLRISLTSPEQKLT